ncbi:rhomboid family intramembrane serine protease [uncultured Aquimarina sp.]|uniref:rhomboid family intramembrane serine protease n=1 Tax=uncultured Aquimarina sp. TaxID=575652 RepID=UPI00260C0122|nr:rhomboid family intramembrane serine protease [uncultured Aquimarina sp.]
MGRITDTVKVLLIINVIVFVGALGIGGYASDQLFALWYPENKNFQIWQVITHMFMHGNGTHIFFNMFVLYMFGSHLENSIGQKKFLFLYFSAGLGAAGLQLLFHYIQFKPALEAHLQSGIPLSSILEMLDEATINRVYYSYKSVPVNVTESLIDSYAIPMVGASGAIAGVIAAFAVLYPNLPLYLMFIPIPIKAKYLVAGYFVLDLFGGITGQSIYGATNIAHWAHIGGAVIGFITMWYWKKNSFNQNRWN